MSFLAIFVALLLEQLRPLLPTNPAYTSARGWVHWVTHHYDAGKPQHAWVAWSIAVVLPTVLVVAVHWLLFSLWGWIAALVWNVVVLYGTLGFRQFSHHFTKIRDALLSGDEDLARNELAQWMRMDASELPRSEIVRHVIEFSVLSAHRHVFGVFAWFSLLAALGLGPAGAVLYRMSEYVSRYANRPVRPTGTSVSSVVQANANRAWQLVDWIPARATALGFAFVGSFEEAVDSWRQHELTHPADSDGVVLAATAGAVNVKLFGPDHTGSGLTPEIAHLRAIVGLVWRTVVMWMVFLALLTLARFLG